MLAHELRNPLAPLRNSLDAPRLDRSDPASFEQVREIMDRQVHQMTRLVDDLLDMSRIALGKLELRKERVDLNAVLQQAVQMNWPLAEVRRQSVSIELPAVHYWIDGDQARLVQVFVNLLNNAVKFTPEEGRLTLRATTDDGHAIVCVRDTGVGIPAEMLTRIFDLFTQVELDSGRTHGGLGIGFRLCGNWSNCTVEDRAESEGPGGGSEFTVTLPLVEYRAVETDWRSGRPQATASRRILLIEDNADGRGSMEMLSSSSDTSRHCRRWSRGIARHWLAAPPKWP